MKCPETNDIQEEFDVCGMNWIQKEMWDRIIDDILATKYIDKMLLDFINDFCRWITSNLEWADEIMVEGTL